MRSPHQILKDRVALCITLPQVDNRTGRWIAVLALVGDAFVVNQLPQRIRVIAMAAVYRQKRDRDGEDYCR